ncbi:hypothetical protein F4808DRAFT_442473 [Astrocystis sublimbata]|nr:hypothetical protein F4808DRAFT_442473 [Astrocystis sublimbata]
MADVRALLRAHRAENRIKHPHAAYSEAGKLLCKLCHEGIKTESLWDAHLRAQSHRQRLQALQKHPSPPTQPAAADESTSKRKRDNDDDEAMSDAQDDDPDTNPAKRSKTDAALTPTNGSRDKDKEKTHTPPGLARRTSGTPIQGVEIAIPSRPATPLAGSHPNVSTPKSSMSRPALVGADTTTTPLPPHKGATSVPTANEAPAQDSMQAPPTNHNATDTTQAPNGAVNDDEWAAFEAEMAELETPAPQPSTAIHTDAVISAPAMTTAQLAAKSQEEENERRKRAAEVEMADEREDATRALEDEFDEMAELEARVRKLKERRETLRKESVMNLQQQAAVTNKSQNANGKENGNNVDDEDESEDDEDGWDDGFRFRV